jgi:HEAT repeat protein
VGDAIPGAERAREAWLRCRGEILRSGPVAAAYCVQQLQTPGPRAGLARELLTELKPEDSREPIASALTSPLPAVRRAGIRAAVWTGQLLAFERQVAGLAGDPAWIVRREAALALGDSHSAEARAALFRALDDHQLLVAREAAVALGKRRVRECGDALLRFLERARAANDPTAIDAALTAFHALSGRKDLGADLTAWRQWVVENRPIVDTRPSAVN